MTFQELHPFAVGIERGRALILIYLERDQPLIREGLSFDVIILIPLVTANIFKIKDLIII